MRSEQQPQDRAETEEEATTDASGTEKAQRGDSPQTAAQGKWPPSHEAQAAAAAEGETPAAVEEEAVVVSISQYQWLYHNHLLIHAVLHEALENKDD